jgi:hypothetical protein
MKLTKSQLREIIKESIIKENQTLTPNWFLSKLNKVKFPTGAWRYLPFAIPTKKGDYKWGYIERTGDRTDWNIKIFFYKNKPVLGTFVNIVGHIRLVWLTDKHVDLDGFKLPEVVFEDDDYAEVFRILRRYKIGQ